MTSPRLVLIGPPGAGKSTVGRLVAERLGVAFRDTDADGEAVAGTSVAEVFYDHGEARFRELETAAVAVALAEHDGVLSLGGGAVLAASTRELLVGHRVVLLLVGLSAAAQRTGLSRDRPVLALNPRAQLRSLLEERRPVYEQVTTVRVDTDGRTPEQVADEVLATLPGPA